jgi:hypothetical protein
MAAPASLCLTCWHKHRPDQHHRWIRFRIHRLAKRLHRKP